MAKQVQPIRETKRVQADLERLLAATLTDKELREKLEPLAKEPAFDGLVWLWGPELYRRNKAMFLPLIRQHFGIDNVLPRQGFVLQKWEGEIATRLTEWLSELDTANEVDLFRRVYNRKHADPRGFGIDETVWQNDLLARFQRAGSAAARQIVLQKFDSAATLDEAHACSLYEHDAFAVKPFILKHLPPIWSHEGRRLWNRLFDLALQHGDAAFAYKIYRQTVIRTEWERVLPGLVGQIADSNELCRELDRRHPEGWGIVTPEPLYALIKMRGRDVLPYVGKHVKAVLSGWNVDRVAFQRLVAFAKEQEWWDFWALLIRASARPDEFNHAVSELIENRSLPDRQIEQRLLLLTGVSREWNMGPFSVAQVQQFNDEVALKLYTRFPHLLRGPFRMNVSVGWHLDLPRLTAACLANNDETLIDYLASRVVTRQAADYTWGAGAVAMAEAFSRYFEPLQADEQQFSRRVAQVLGQVPAYSVGNYNALMRTNRLARLFYGLSAPKLLSNPTVIRDLLESPEIHTQALAFKALGLNRHAAKQLAAANLDLLQATLLRPLHRKTRILAFKALAGAAIDLTTARRIHQRCREALSLPDRRYPKEQLTGLIGQLLHNWPTLCTSREQRVIYRRAIISHAQI